MLCLFLARTDPVKPRRVGEVRLKLYAANGGNRGGRKTGASSREVIPKEPTAWIFTSMGTGYGQATVYPMFGIPDFGSLKLEKYLPVFTDFKIERIVMYPLLLHALNNFTNLKWTSDPKGIKETRLTAFKGLLAKLSSDCNLGGWRVEATCKGRNSFLRNYGV